MRCAFDTRVGSLVRRYGTGVKKTKNAILKTHKQIFSGVEPCSIFARSSCLQVNPLLPAAA